MHRFEYRDSVFTKYDSLRPRLDSIPLTIYPHTNWRGDYHLGTFGTGETGRCVQVPQNETDHEMVGGTQTGTGTIELYWTYCMAAVKWPGKHVWLDHSRRSTPPGNPDLWIGSLVFNKRDLTGNLYMRNRYYDPQAGRFTQEDPIGLAGGLNAYGFAAGDPVTYSDPYGLFQCPGSPGCPAARLPGTHMAEQLQRVSGPGTLDRFLDNFSVGVSGTGGNSTVGFTAKNDGTQEVGPGQHCGHLLCTVKYFTRASPR